VLRCIVSAGNSILWKPSSATISNHSVLPQVIRFGGHPTSVKGGFMIEILIAGGVFSLIIVVAALILDRTGERLDFGS
jgi:hypothetical protein